MTDSSGPAKKRFKEIPTTSNCLSVGAHDYERTRRERERVRFSEVIIFLSSTLPVPALIGRRLHSKRFNDSRRIARTGKSFLLFTFTFPLNSEVVEAATLALYLRGILLLRCCSWQQQQQRLQVGRSLSARRKRAGRAYIARPSRAMPLAW